MQKIPHWEVSNVYDAKDRAILAWSDALILQGGRASDELFEALHSHLSDKDILELTYHIMGYNLHAGFFARLSPGNTMMYQNE
ncbi:MAG: hypothetical protein CM1200mP40_02010 [Gammaproteobacteria bacterium]|nr:MAG: hypothetical protein CM1200mP40_02010 [Gammaproteobacteria bacterium]